MSKTSATWVQELKDPGCYPHPISEVSIIETHISWVILTGQSAYKIKKPVSFSFVDFSTLERRRWFCEEEVRLNRRLAPDIYLGVVPLTGSPSAPRVAGEGVPFEFAVKMKQFPSGQEVNKLLACKEKAEVFISELADTVAQFHVRIEKAGKQSAYANPDMIWQAVGECVNDIPLPLLTRDTQECLTTIDTWLRKEWRRLHEVFRQRKQSGYVRECHGDLHLGNIAVFEEDVCVFDALEFEPRLRWIDVMSEVAFLVMDLQKNGRWELAFLFVNRYLEETGDYSGMDVFRFYQVYRALVRAKVAGLRLEQIEKGKGEWERTCQEMVEYIELSYRMIKSSSSFLILMHGVSGTGKTTVSAEVVKILGAIRIRSDVERKRLRSDKENENFAEGPEADLYTSDMTRRTYERLQNMARILLHGGSSVVVDGTFLQRGQREAFLLLAKERSCAFVILDVFAPSAVLTERIERRAQEGRDASDATVAIMERQQKTEESFTQTEQLHVIKVDSTDPQAIVSAISELRTRETITSQNSSQDLGQIESI
jgi:aminoglycoside phosphotransferase family enzyme/gluconate kinase